MVDIAFYECTQVSNIVQQKFITLTTRTDTERLRLMSENVINKVKLYVTNIGRDNVHKTDNSGLNFELHSDRTLAPKGQKTVEGIV